jgi:toxin ParE1/3/4
VLELAYSDLAEYDLISIWLYTSDEWSFAQADTYLNQINSGIGHLIPNPMLGKDRNDLRNGYRSIQIKYHIVFYKITNSQIQIIRILHESSDIEQHV